MCLMQRLNYSIVYFILLTAVVFSGCRKADRDYDNSLWASEDQTLMEQLSFDLFMIVDEACSKAYGITPAYTTGRLDCATVSVNLSSTPRIISISFGSDGCLNQDGRLRAGSVVVQITGDYNVVGSSVEISTSNYKVDGYQLNADHAFTIDGPNSDGKNVYNFQYLNWQLTDSLNRISTLSTNRTRTRIDGSSTLQISDDLYLTSGTSCTGISRSGNSFNAVISSALLQSGDCRYVIAGSLEVNPNNLATRFVDYGEQCDSNVTVTINKTLYYFAQH